MHVIVPEGTLVAGASITLEADEAHHLDVRRAAAGASARAIDGAGGLAMGQLLREGSGWLFEVEMVVIEPRPARTILAVGAGDRDRFLTLVEKAAELGVSRIIPLDTRLSRGVENRLREGTLGKARRRVREACKQCGNAWFPQVDVVTALDELGNAEPDARWFLADPRGAPLPPIGAQEPVGWLIGPEGGFEPEEVIDLERDLAAEAVTLGRHVLRFETAAIAAAVVTEGARAAAARTRRG